MKLILLETQMEVLRFKPSTLSIRLVFDWPANHLSHHGSVRNWVINTQLIQAYDLATPIVITVTVDSLALKVVIKSHQYEFGDSLHGRIVNNAQ